MKKRYLFFGLLSNLWKKKVTSLNGISFEKIILSFEKVFFCWLYFLKESKKACLSIMFEKKCYQWVANGSPKNCHLPYDWWISRKRLPME